MRKLVTGFEVAYRILEEVLHDPELSDLIERMLADPQVDRRELFHTAFTQGVMQTLEVLGEGRILNVSDRN